MKNVKFIFCISLLFPLLSGTCDEETCKETPDPDCVCTMQYDPVCGCNDKTYGNACEAECNGITEYTKGECRK